MRLHPVFAPGEPDLAVAKPHLERALRYTKDWTLEDVFSAVRARTVLLVTCLDDAGRVRGAGVVQVEPLPARKALVVHLFGAVTGSKWEPLLDDLRTFGGHLGCSIVRGYGRSGWVRKLGARPLYGWEVDV